MSPEDPAIRMCSPPTGSPNFIAAAFRPAVPPHSRTAAGGFVEISPELARELGIENLDWVVLTTARGEIETRALVTERLRPFTIDGRTIYQIGMPWLFGWEGYATGDIANALPLWSATPTPAFTKVSR